MLTDVKMPGMDGWELLKKAKDLDPDLPVVMVAGFADIPGAVGAIKVGAHDYLAKPFDNYEVIRVVRRALAERELKRKMLELSSRSERPVPARNHGSQ
jgi:FixJ family two-component response regulator